MTDKKYTDEEIVRALKCHINAEDCVSCEMFGRCDEIILTDIVLNLINRQKSEIERKNSFIENQNELISKLALAEKNARTEAYKEFAERIKMSIKANVVETLCNDVKGVYKAEYVLDDIDNLLKEMIGDEE